MGSTIVVVGSPVGQHLPGVPQVVEQGFIQAFIAQASVETFHECILGRFAGLDIVPFNLLCLRSG